MNTQTPYLLALLLILTGCSNEIGIEQELHPTDEVPVPILIMPRGIEATTKAPVDIFNKENVTNIGIYGKSGSNVIYENHPSQITDEQLLFNDHPLVYPVDNSQVTLYGYYPHTSNLGTPYTIADNLLSFTLTGEEDLMYASGVNAGNKKAPTPVSLNFVHKLTNVKFKLVNGSGGVLTPGAISISTTAQNSGSMDLLTGTISLISSSHTYSLLTGIAAEKLNQDTVTVENSLLLLPQSVTKADYTFKLNIDSQSYNINIDNSNRPNWQEGISYLLTITIKSLDKPTSLSTRSATTNENASEAIIQGTITQQQSI